MSDITLKTVEDLSNFEKLELIQFSATTYFKTVCKLMEMEVISARDVAMTVDPVNTREQTARMTEAHAMARFYTRFRKTVENMAKEHMGELRAAAAEEAAQDQDIIEQIILAQASG